MNMKKKDLLELRAKEIKELQSLLAKKKQELAKMMLELRAGKIKNVHVGKNLRKDMAQILTIMKEKG